MKHLQEVLQYLLDKRWDDRGLPVQCCRTGNKSVYTQRLFAPVSFAAAGPALETDCCDGENEYLKTS